jgi:DNA-binding LytR/AlgR family response regulator
MIRIAVCDDEAVFLDKAMEMLEEYEKTREESFDAHGFSVPSELLDRIEAGEIYDIYLLDIYMPGVSGMSLATELRSRDIKCPVIFLTSSTDHALEAFGVDATHYLLKPYTREHFFSAMDKAMQSLWVPQRNSVVLKVDHTYRSISTGEILFCESEDKYQRIYLENGENLLVRMTMAELFGTLEPFSSFCRCGRAHIINLTHLSKVTAATAVLKNRLQIPLSRSAAAALRTAFFDYFD